MMYFCSSEGNKEQMCPGRSILHPSFPCVCVPEVGFPWMTHPDFLVLWLQVGIGQWDSLAGDQSWVYYCVPTALCWSRGCTPLLMAKLLSGSCSLMATGSHKGTLFLPLQDRDDHGFLPSMIPWCFPNPWLIL